jgi:imidazolonepropionase
MIDADLLVTNIRELLTCHGPAPLVGSRQREVTSVRDAALASKDGRLVFVGTAPEAEAIVSVTGDGTTYDASGYSVVPGFVDPHTHAVFAGDRREELRRRLAGATYAEIAAAGGGIVSTVTATRAATEDQLVEGTSARLDEMLACGTTTCEVKSGYGLDTETELKMLRAIGRATARHAVDVVPTFMGAHEVPIEYRDQREVYVDLVVNEMIPRVAAEGTARWCDVFCETGVFTPEESTRILEAGLRAGMAARIHADELGASGGSQVAAAVGARSADHLVFVPPDGIDAMARAGVVATLLPIAAFYLKLGRFAPARALIDGGVAVALATDVNPGGGFSPSMPFAMTLACFGMGLTFEESLTAATINAAHSLDLASDRGSLEAGKRADFVVIAGDAINLIRVGVPAIQAVFKDGRSVWTQEKRNRLNAASR